MAWLRRDRCATLPTWQVTGGGTSTVPSSGPRLATIPLDRIVGSISRCCDFDRCFRVLRAHLRPRLEQVRRTWHGRPFPPVRLVQHGVYFWVVDGHHRLALAHERGMTAVDALVTSA